MNDSQCFLLGHFDIIYNSPSSVYHSALPLCPTSSWLRESYSAELSQGVKVVKGLPAEWETSFRTVTFNEGTNSLACWKDTIAVGLYSGDIIILDGITGSQAAVLSGHTHGVSSITFLPDGKSLVSGSWDGTIKLWDMQTGGVVKTFCGHKKPITSVSVSPDCTVIASGSHDLGICLWDIGTGKCHRVIDPSHLMEHVEFSPSNPQHLICINEDGTIKQWDVNGHQIGPTHEGSYATFSPDGIYFALCSERVVTVQNSDSRKIVASCLSPSDNLTHCCFSPDSKFLAGASTSTIYVWDIASSDPHLVNTFVGHTWVTSIIFSSSLTLLSKGESVRFWDIGASSTNPVATDSESTPSTLAPISSITLQANDGIVITCNSAGTVRTWDISTGYCKESFHPTARDIAGVSRIETRLIGGRLIVVWAEGNEIHIWDTGKEEALQIIDAKWEKWAGSLRISGDGSKIFWLCDYSVQAWSIPTGKAVGKIRLRKDGSGIPDLHPFHINDSKIWICFKDLSTQGWDFGVSGSSPIPLSKMASDRLHLHYTHSQSRIEDTVTRQDVFQLSGRYARPDCMQWDGQYLAAGYESGEVLILDFNHMLS